MNSDGKCLTGNAMVGEGRQFLGGRTIRWAYSLPRGRRYPRDAKGKGGGCETTFQWGSVTISGDTEGAGALTFPWIRH